MYEFCEAISEISHEFIHFPTNGRETAITIHKFRAFTESKIPQAVGVNGGTHIEKLCVDLERRVDYFSRKQRFSINTQAVVRANLMFLHIATGYPGSLHDARILGLSNLYTRAEREEILKTPSKVIEGVSLRPLLLIDSAYPMTLWQVKPFSFTLNLTKREKLFNKHLSSARVIVEQAFGVLKGCFRILLKRIDIGLENTVKTIITCCVLHNIRQLRRDFYIDDDNVFDQVLQNERLMRRAQQANNNAHCPNANALTKCPFLFFFS